MSPTHYSSGNLNRDILWKSGLVRFERNVYVRTHYLREFSPRIQEKSEVDFIVLSVSDGFHLCNKIVFCFYNIPATSQNQSHEIWLDKSNNKFEPM